MLGGGPGLDLALVEPESNLLLGALNAVGAVADVAANINGVVATDGARCRSQWVGGTEESYRERKLASFEQYQILKYVLRPVLTASRPSQTIAQMGPLPMSIYC